MIVTLVGEQPDIGLRRDAAHDDSSLNKTYWTEAAFPIALARLRMAIA